MRVLVTGATGFVGGAVCAAFLAEGHDVLGLVRDPARVGRAASADLRRKDMPDPSPMGVGHARQVLGWRPERPRFRDAVAAVVARTPA